MATSDEASATTVSASEYEALGTTDAVVGGGTDQTTEPVVQPTESYTNEIRLAIAEIESISFDGGFLVIRRRREQDDSSKSEMQPAQEAISAASEALQGGVLDVAVGS